MADIIGLNDVSSTDASPLKTGGRRKHNMKKKSKGLKDACWKGYEAIGFKMKSGKKVPNCVKKKNNMDDKCKTGTVYSTKLKKCVSKKSPWSKYMSGGNLWLKNKATKQEKAVVDSMQKEIMSRGKKKTKKKRGN